MSYVAVYKVGPDGALSEYGEVVNASAFCSVVWDALGDKYDIPRRDSMFRDRGRVSSDENAVRKLWDMCGSGKLDPLDDILLAATFDLVWFRQGDVLQLAEACRRFHAEHVAGTGIDPTVKRIGAMLLALLAEHPEALGAAFYGHSVGEDLWQTEDPCPACGCTCCSEFRFRNVLTDPTAPDGDYNADEPCAYKPVARNHDSGVAE